jgi:hypothetical protein
VLRKTFALPIALLLAFALLMTACVDAEPESATNEVGESHEITATADEEFVDDLCDEEELDCDDWLAIFIVADGPGEGESNLVCNFLDADELEECLDELEECVFESSNPEECLVEGDECDPEGCVADLDDPISWTYENNGDDGTDTIAVCLIPIFDEQEALTSLLESRSQQVMQQALTDEEIDQLEDQGCDIVTKTWVDPEPTPTPVATVRPNIAAALSGALGGGRNNAAEQAAAQAAAQQQAAAAAGAIRPPSTGDAGLR